MEETSSFMTESVDRIPFFVGVASKVQGHESTRPYLVLADPGSTSTWISCQALPKGVCSKKVKEVKGSTLAGSFKSNQEVVLTRVTFPEFFKTRSVDEIKARVFEAPCRYDIILGRDVLHEMELIIDFKECSMKWYDSSVSMRPYPKDDQLYRKHSK